MISKALVAASTKPMILSILVRGEDYGYQIIQRVKDIKSHFGLEGPVVRLPHSRKHTIRPARSTGSTGTRPCPPPAPARP